MTRIAAVHGALAPYRHTQSEITDMVARTCLPAGTDRRVLDRLHSGARVRSRHMTLPLDDYAKLDGFGATNDVFISTAGDLAPKRSEERCGLRGWDRPMWICCCSPPSPESPRPPSTPTSSGGWGCGPM